MKEGLVLKYRWVLVLIAIVPFLFTNNVKAEVLLIKGEKEFLGWKLEDNKFKTCNEKIIKIEKDDKIVETDDICQRGRKIVPKAKKAKKAE